MRPSVLLKTAGKNILKHKMRVLLTMLGISIGIGAVIVMVAIGQGAQTQIEQKIQSLGTNLLVVSPGSSNTGGSRQGAGSFNRLRVADCDKIRREATLLTAVSPVIVTPTQVIAEKGNWRTEVNGVSTDYLTIRDWNVASGELFDDDDVLVKRKVVVLGNTVKENLFPDTDPVGVQIRLGRVPFTVIGVLAPKGQTATGSDQDDKVLVPYTTVQDRLSGFSFLAQIVASARSRADIPAACEEIRGIMREAHALASDASDDFTVRDQTALASAASSTTTIMTSLLSAIASLSLLVGGIGIMNTMLISVTERTREIGIRMAVGARGSDVLGQFLVESILISLFGGILGLAAGIGGSKIISYFTGWRTATPLPTILLAVGVAGAVGVFFGYYPARKAAALDPIRALHYE